MSADTRLRDAVEAVRARLATAGVPTPDVDAELLVRHVTGWSRARLILDGAQPLPSAAAARLAALVERRAAREPLQLLLGTVGFRHLELEVTPGVFIPRPETEVLAGAAIARVPRGGLVVEPCTGTGAVACAVATEVPGVRVHATDVSPAAVALARRNAARAGADVQVWQGDLLDPLPRELRGRVDVLVSNPPYVADEEVAALEPEVVVWDPRAALVAGPTGHEVSDRLIAAAPAWLRPGGWLLLEVATERVHETANRALAAGLVCAEVLSDLTGRPRVAVCQAEQRMRRDK